MQERIEYQDARPPSFGTVVRLPTRTNLLIASFNRPWYKGRILVVEDNPILQRMRSFQLKALRFEPIIVASHEDALNLAACDDIDLILIDLDRQDRSALEIVRAIRTAERDAETKTKPIIGISTSAKLKACIAAGVDEIERKPIATRDVNRILRRWYCGSW